MKITDQRGLRHGLVTWDAIPCGQIAVTGIETAETFFLKTSSGDGINMSNGGHLPRNGMYIGCKYRHVEAELVISKNL